jgi:5'-nucleotidase
MEKISRRSFLKQSMIVGAGATLLVFSDGSYRLKVAQAQDAAFRMRVLHSNDHHARIEPVDGSNGPLHGGVSRRKALIDRIRATEPLPLMLVDCGDVFQGTLYFNQYNGQADLEFYNAMGYEAMAVGNHEFNKGPAILADFIRRANFPVLSANIATTPDSPIAGLVRPSTIVEKGGRRIGIFSLSPEDTGVLSQAGDTVQFTAALDAARAQVQALRDAGVFTIIALTHVGITVDRQIAAQVGGISMIIGGHSHTPMGPMTSSGNPPYPELVAGPDGKPVVIVSAWEWGRWLGDLTVAFNSDGTILDVQGNPTEVLASLPADPGFEARIAVLRAPLVELRARVIGETLVNLDGSRDNVRSRETNLGNLIADAMLEKATPSGAQIAITNGGGIRSSIPAGPVTVGQVLEVLPFGNTLALVTITGAQVREALENGFSQIESGAGRFPQVGGIRVSYDPTAEPGSRVTAITYQNQNIDPDADYVIVTNNFMLGGGDGYSAFRQGRNGLDAGFILADVVADYITANSPVNVDVDGRINTTTQPVILPAPIDPEPAPAPAPEPAPVPAPEIPISLPNTGAPLAPLGWLASLGASALAGGIALRRRGQKLAEAEAEAARELVEVEHKDA